LQMGILSSLIDGIGGSKYPLCECGAKMTEYDGNAWYTCPVCGNMKRNNGDGTWSWERDVFSSSNRGECVSCGNSLASGDYAMPWEDGDNEYGYVTCPSCGYKNIRD